jgi:Zn-dependent peptidase ImmA (M78 family)
MRSGIVGNNTHRSLDVTEFRGFALSDPYAPLIFINSKDAKAAQLFTLAHELVHIWLGVSGVSNLNLTYSPDVDVERFCNAVAAELLVPLDELQAEWSSRHDSVDKIPMTARHFRVSSLVILRRLLDAKYISREEFQRLYNDELAKMHQQDAATEGGGDFYRTLNTRLGKRFVSALIESTLEGGTPYRQAFQLLGVKNAEAVRKLASKLGAAA